LVGQGLTLPWVVRALGLANAGRLEQAARRTEEFLARREAIEVAGRHLDALAAAADIPEDVIARLRAHHKKRLEQNLIRSDERDEQRKRVAQGDQLELLLIADERDLINEQYYEGGLKAETRRRLERELDLREVQLASVRNEEYLE
jgi:CPA1 family monovalent cation:H+ antiporter